MIICRGLSVEDKEALETLQLDEENDFELYDFIGESLDEEDSTYAYGVFADGELVGQCSIGGIDEFEDYLSTDEVLSDVFVKAEYRHRGLATKLIQYAVNDKSHRENNIVCMAIYETDSLYISLGFIKNDINDYILRRK